MKRPWIRGKDFFNFHGIKRTSSRRGLEKLGGEEFLGLFFLCDFLRKRRKRMRSLSRWWKGGKWVGCWGYFEEYK
jgi:hypothetical protein